MTPTQQKLIIACPSYEQFMEQYKTAQLMVVYNDINTIAKSVGVITPRLRLEDISIAYSTAKRNSGVDYVDSWLKYLNEFSNLNKKLTETKAVAYMIYQKYKYFYLTDMKLIFEKIMQCEYGIFYGSVDAPRILGAFLSYAQEREDVFDKMKKYVSKEFNMYMEPLCAQEYKEIYKRIKPNFEDEKELKEECSRIYQTEAIPRLDKIRDEIEPEIIKKYIQ